MPNKIFFFVLFLPIALFGSWDEYKDLYITKEGRVIDKNNKNITHTEGIGYAMFLALSHNDMTCFKKIHTWYKHHLTQNRFGLLGWKWGKDKNGSMRLLDYNNATDGDLWIAYDNLLAYEKTKQAVYKQEALKHIQHIKKHLIITNKEMIYLLPGKLGFERKKTFDINLSYYIFFIFEKFAYYDDKQLWQKLTSDGIKLLYKARFSSIHLPSDWITVSKKDNSIKPSKNNSFGYDAIRIPLHIIKSNISNKEKLLEPYKNYIKSMNVIHSVFGVCNFTNGNISLYNYSYGHLVIYNLIENFFHIKSSFDKRIKKLQQEHKNDYYSYSLYLLSHSL